MTPVPARTDAEAFEYLLFERCACGYLTTPEDPDDDIVTAKLTGVHWIGYDCPSCDREVSIGYTRTEPPREPAEEFFYGRGPQPSQLIDAGGWARAAVRQCDEAVRGIAALGGKAPSGDQMTWLAGALTRAAAAAEEALRFLPPGAAVLPDDAFFTEVGREQRQRDPGSVGVARLRELAVDCRRRLSELVEVYQRRHGMTGTYLELSLFGSLYLPYGTRHKDAPFPARTLHEARIYATWLECRCGALADELSRSTLRDNGEVFTQFYCACPRCGRPREFLFRNVANAAVELPWDALWSVDERPSLLFDAAGFVTAGTGLIEAALPLIAGNPSGDWYQIHWLLRMAAAGFDEALKFVPPGADRVPADAFWDKDVLARYRDRMETFERATLEWLRDVAYRRLDDFLAAHAEPDDEDDDELRDGDGDVEEPPLRARSAAERWAYLGLHPCGCGTLAFEPQEPTGETVGGEEVLRYRGHCVQCGELREATFAAASEVDLPEGSGGWAVGTEPSTIIDAYQWLIVARGGDPVADALTGDAPEWAGMRSHAPAEMRALRARDYLVRAASAVDEALKFLPDGADRVPDTAVWSINGRVHLPEEAHLLTRESLEAEQAQRWQRAGGRSPDG
jgi:hypothetical protein